MTAVRHVSIETELLSVGLSAFPTGIVLWMWDGMGFFLVCFSFCSPVGEDVHSLFIDIRFRAEFTQALDTGGRHESVILATRGQNFPQETTTNLERVRFFLCGMRWNTIDL